MVSNKMEIANSTVEFVDNTLLKKCAHKIESGDLLGAMTLCKQFLEHYPLSRQVNEMDESAHLNYVKLAENMLGHQHNYEAVMDLLLTKDHVLAFVQAFYVEKDKKGFHFPTPKIQLEDVNFAYQFCVGFHSMISSKLVDNNL